MKLLKKQKQQTRKEIPIGSVGTLSELKVWVDEIKPDVIVIPINHTLTHIREFNHNFKEKWTSFNGIPIEYSEFRYQYHE